MDGKKFTTSRGRVRHCRRAVQRPWRIIDLRSVVLRHCRSAATAKSQWARGVRVYEIVERTVVHPRFEGTNWDSADTAVHISGFRPVTIPSLRGYLGPLTDEEEI